MIGTQNMGYTVIAAVPLIPGKDEWIVTAQSADYMHLVTWHAFAGHGKISFAWGNYFHSPYDTPDSIQVTTRQALANMAKRAGLTEE